jgi:lipoate-protein ligase A
VWHEINLNVLKNSDANTHIARRESGGGCVYHDLGNCNLTFFSTRHLPYENLQIVQQALSSLGYDAFINQARHEILIDQKKISGSAFRITGKDKACYHHCTMLIDSDLSHLNKILTSNLSAESYATQSVRSHVTNLRQMNTKISIPTFFDAMKDSFIKFHGKPLEIMPIPSEEEMLEIPRVRETYNKFKSWEWIYGQTPKFTTTLSHLFPWGSLLISLTCDKGEFQSVDINIDSTKNELSCMLESILLNKNIGDLPNYQSSFPYDPFETDEQEAKEMNEKVQLFFQWFLKFW